MMGEVLCSYFYHTLTPDLEHIQIGIFCLPTRKNIGILFLDSLQCYRVNTLEFRHWLRAAAEPHSSVCKRCIPGPVNESLKSFCMQAVFWSRTRDWKIQKQRTASILDLVLWFFPVPCTELTEEKEEETRFGFSHLKSVVTPQPFSVLLFFFFNVLL